MSKIKIIDCTLHDGGNYNKWNFDRGTIDRYLTAVKASSVDVVELGIPFIAKRYVYGTLISTRLMNFCQF